MCMNQLFWNERDVCFVWVNLLCIPSVPPWMPDVLLTPLILFNIITFQVEIESLTRYVSPVNPAVFPHLTVVLLGIGIFFTAWFFVYEVTSTKFTRDIFKELLVALVAAIFSGFGVLFLLLWVGIYVWLVSTQSNRTFDSGLYCFIQIVNYSVIVVILCVVFVSIKKCASAVTNWIPPPQKKQTVSGPLSLLKCFTTQEGEWGWGESMRDVCVNGINI